MEDGREKGVSLFDDDEDQKRDKEEVDKVEKFFELIRNLREARNRLLIKAESTAGTTRSVKDDEQVLVSEENDEKKRNQNDNNNNNNKNKKRKKRDVMNWVPSFEKEDFTADVEFRGTPSVFPAPCNATDKRHVKDATKLDLNLTL